MRSLIFFIGATLLAQHAPIKPGNVVPRVWEGYGNLHFEVSSSNPEARAWANQGLRMVYAFNHPEAAASFAKAAELDPACAMCLWGYAFALGNNINMPLMPEYAKPAYDAAQKALPMKASPRERAYIEALAQRYAEKNPEDRSALDRAYAEAMGKVAAAYPDDLNAQVLYADALMNLTPWKLWNRQGEPNTHTLKIVALLEGVLQRDPKHMGANHLYIHAVEASRTPERALPSADLLGALASGSGHLVHMPAHIYMRTGDYESAAAVNAKAAELDKRYFAAVAGPTYYMPYWVHNLHFLSAARAMQGRYAEARAAIGEAAQQLEILARQDPMFEPALAMPMLLEVRFQKWDEILARPEPGSFSLSVQNAWHFARGMASASKGLMKEAKLEAKLFRAAVAKLSSDRGFGLNKEKDVMGIAALMLDAKIAQAAGRLSEAIVFVGKAVVLEDALAYDEPAGWYYPPSREALGALLLEAKQAERAEKVFREELENNRRNGRALYGLHRALMEQGKKDEANLIQPRYEAAWSRADAPLTLANLF